MVEAELAIGIPRLGIGILIVTDGSFLLHLHHSLLTLTDHVAKVRAQILRIEASCVSLAQDFAQIQLDVDVGLICG